MSNLIQSYDIPNPITVPINIQDGDGQYLKVPKLTTIQRDALAIVDAMIIYNSTTNKVQFRQNGAWVDLPGAYTLPQATTSVIGGAELATQAEVDAGSDNLRIVTPLTLANAEGLGNNIGSLVFSGEELLRNGTNYADESGSYTGHADYGYWVNHQMSANWLHHARIALQITQWGSPFYIYNMRTVTLISPDTSSIMTAVLNGTGVLYENALSNYTDLNHLLYDSPVVILNGKVTGIGGALGRDVSISRVAGWVSVCGRGSSVYGNLFSQVMREAIVEAWS